LSTPFQITANTTQPIAPIPTASTPNSSTIDSSDQQIQYTGDWSQVKSSCDSSVMAMISSQLNSYLTYSFKVLQGGAVYVDFTQGPDAGVFLVELDGVQGEIDAYSNSTPTSCSFPWSKTGLAAGLHNLTIVFTGPSPQSPTMTPGSFELNGIELTSPDFGNNTPVTTTTSGASLASKICSDLFFFGFIVVVLLRIF
jgi:hypothetical protein